MRKLLIVMLCAAFLVSAAACSKEPIVLDKVEPASAVTAAGYSVSGTSIEAAVENGSYDFSYPQIEGMADETVMAAANKLIADKVSAHYKSTALEGVDKPFFDYKIDDASVMCATDKIFSVVVRGNYYVEEAAHPSVFCYTINIDLTTGEEIPSEALIADLAALKSAFESGVFAVEYGVEGLLDQTGFADMYIEYKPEYGICPPVYLTQSGVGVAIELVYALGGCAYFETPYNAAAAFIDTSNAGVKALYDAAVDSVVTSEE